MATVKDVALAAGVSTATVSRVVNGDARVLPRTKEKVLAAIEMLHYKIHPAARSLKSGVSLLVGVIVPELTNVFFMAMCERLGKVLRNAGYSMILCSSNNSLHGEMEQIKNLTEQLVDGIIVIPAKKNFSHFIPLQKKIPIVFADRGFTGLNADYVLSDNETGAYEAVCALIKDGFTKIGFIGGDMDLLTCRERYAGYCRALQEAGLPIDANVVCMSGMGLESGYAGLDSLLKKAEVPQSFFFVNLLCALGSARRIMEEPYVFQQSLVCATFDYVFYSSLMRWCRYFVDQPAEEFGETAAKLILRRISRASQQKQDCVLDYETVRIKTVLRTAL